MSKMRDDTRGAKEEASNFETNYVSEVGRSRDEVGEFTKRICQPVPSAVAGSMELMSVNA